MWWAKRRFTRHKSLRTLVPCASPTAGVRALRLESFRDLRVQAAVRTLAARRRGKRRHSPPRQGRLRADWPHVAACRSWSSQAHAIAFVVAGAGVGRRCSDAARRHCPPAAESNGSGTRLAWPRLFGNWPNRVLAAVAFIARCDSGSRWLEPRRAPNLRVFLRPILPRIVAAAAIAWGKGGRLRRAGGSSLPAVIRTARPTSDEHGGVFSARRPNQLPAAGAM